MAVGALLFERPRTRWTAGLVSALPTALAALTLLVPLRHAGRGRPIDYDEGVYATGARLLSQGHVPYRDFVLVHPPALQILLAPIWLFQSPFGAAVCLRLSRVAVAGLSIATVALLSSVVARRVNVLGGLVAGGLLACCPATFVLNRSVFTEPVANFFLVLALFAVWRDRADAPDRRVWLGGLACGVAMLCKYPAVGAVPAVALAAWYTTDMADAAQLRRRRRRPTPGSPRRAVGVRRARGFWRQTVQAQLRRPAAGIPVNERLRTSSPLRNGLSCTIRTSACSL
jgi:hypothetical protein